VIRIKQKIEKSNINKIKNNILNENKQRFNLKSLNFTLNSLSRQGFADDYLKLYIAEFLNTINYVFRIFSNQKEYEVVFNYLALFIYSLYEKNHK